mgnify:CR=1 FL=1
MKRNNIHSVIILGSISLIGIIIFQVFWIYNTFSSDEKQLDLSIKNALFNVAHQMAEFNEAQKPNINPVNQISSNNFVVNIDDVIDPIILEHFLETAFENSHINIDYEYAIYDCESDDMVHVKRINMTGKKEKKLEEGDFKKFNDFNYYFSIRFPNKTISILYDMNVWAISAFVLIMAFLFFVYAIFIIMRQKKLSDVQKDFINNMTHELKTPISTIGISAKVISDPEISKQPERLAKYASIISHQNKRLENQVEKVLKSTLAEKGRIHLEKESFLLNECIEEVVRDFDLKAREKNGSIDFEKDARVGPIFADKSHFENLLFNLLDNALKYCKETPQVQVSTQLKGSNLYLSIADNGIGIEEKYRKKIFDKFYRVPTGDVHDVKGFGLGLDYVKSIVKAHQWKMGVKAGEIKGSVFIIIIPQEKHG